MHRLWPDKRTKPPLGAARLDVNHPLARGLTNCVLFDQGAGAPQDLVNSELTSGLTVNGGPLPWISGPQGPAGSFTTATTYLSISTINSTVAWSSEMWVKPVAFDATNPNGLASVFVVFNTNGHTQDLSIAVATRKYEIFVWDGVNIRVVLSLAAAVIGQWAHVVGVADSATNLLTLYVNGVFQGSTGISNVSDPISSPTFEVGRGGASNSNADKTANAEIALVRRWAARALTASEVLQLYADPYAMFQPVKRPRLASTTTAVAAAARSRWRNDDGTEVTATWKSAEDVAASLAVATAARLRVRIDTANDQPSQGYQLEYRKVGDTAWKKAQ